MNKQTAIAAAMALAMAMPSVGLCRALSIEEAVDLAMEQNTSLQITQQGERTAAAKLKSARGANSFSVGVNGNLSRNKPEDESAKDSTSGGVTAKIPLYTGGKNQANIKSGELGVDVAALTTERARENLRLDVIKSYYNVLEADKTVQIDSESVDRYKVHLANVQQMYEAGTKAKLDVLRSSVELSNAEQTLIKAQNTYEVDVAALKNLLRLDQNEPVTLTDDFSFVLFSPTLENCLDYAFLHHKALIIDDYKLKQEELAIVAARSGWLPSLNASASADLTQKLRPDRESSHAYSAGLSANWNVFDSGVTSAAIDTAKTNRDVALLTLQRDREDVDYQLRQAYYNMREAEKRFISTKAAVSEAEENYFITREKYRVGQGILLDVLDAQVALSTANLNFISAQYDYARYKATVENAMGLALNLSPEIAQPRQPNGGE